MRLSEFEAQAKSSKGLCFWCDEKGHGGHRWRLPLHLIIVGDVDGDEHELLDLERLEVEDELAKIEVSLNALERLVEPRTLNLRGLIGEQTMVVLIDCGATHNFISPNLIHELGLASYAIPNYWVLVGKEKCMLDKGYADNYTYSWKN